MRFLFLLLTAAVVGWLIRRSLRSSRSDTRPTARDAANQELMVVCTHCQVHLPRSEAIFEGDLAFCAEAHRLAHRELSARP
jgi:hypothetical protein